MDPRALAKAMAQGAPITCATCKFFHEGNGFCGKSACGGPGAGRDFPLYDGPIPRDKFADRCLVCGDGNVEFLIVGLNTKFGLCRRHRKVFEHVGQGDPDKMKHPVNLIALGPHDIPDPVKLKLPTKQDPEGT